MILAHVLDAWTRTADRNTAAFRGLVVLGGLAAPLFLWLAGLALALGGERAAARQPGGRQAAVLTVVRRGLEIFVLAFLFRLQAFVVTPGGPLIKIFQVDILNIMGPAIVAAGLVWGAARRPRWAALFCGVAAAAIGLSTPLVRSALWVEKLPIWFQWYFQSTGDLTTFTLFPWSGFVFAGAAVGSVLSMAVEARTERRALLAIGTAGGALIGLGWLAAAQPAIYASSSFWTDSPTWFTIRLGVVMLTLLLVYAVSEVSALPAVVLSGLQQFGRHSLFIYWIHVELVYGYASWPIHRALGVWGATASFVVFSGVMYGALRLRDHVVSRSAVRVSRPRPQERRTAGVSGGDSPGDTLRFLRLRS